MAPVVGMTGRFGIGSRMDREYPQGRRGGKKGFPTTGERSPHLGRSVALSQHVGWVAQELPRQPEYGSGSRMRRVRSHHQMAFAVRGRVGPCGYRFAETGRVEDRLMK